MSGRGLFFGTFSGRSNLPPAGWYIDHASDVRYWDGHEWTGHVWSPPSQVATRTYRVQIRCTFRFARED